jgi:hypothetical protein
MPHRVALALQRDGWTIRQVFHWFKKNCMPESVSGWTWKQHMIKAGRTSADWKVLPKGWQAGEVTHDAIPEGNYRKVDAEDDTVAEWIPCQGCPTCTPNDGLVLRKGSWRHTSAVEYVFMLTKGEDYWADQQVVKESASDTGRINGRDGRDEDELARPPGSNPRTLARLDFTALGRNPRNFTLLAGESYSGAHFATFPVSLILPLIKATRPKRCCQTCGQGWAPVIGEREVTDGRGSGNKERLLADGAERGRMNTHLGSSIPWSPTITSITGYRPTCSCDVAESIPGIALDPFCGSGTTGEVCNMLGLRFVGIDLSMPYLRDQAAVRVEHRAIDTKVEDLPLFAGLPQEVEISDAETTVGHPKET